MQKNCKKKILISRDRDAIELVFCLAIYYWTWGLFMRIICFPNGTPLEKTKFLFASAYQLEMASGWGMETVSASLSALGPHLVNIWACCLGLCELLCVPPLLCLESLDSLAFSILSDSSIREGGCVPRCEGERTTWRSWFSPLSMWDCSNLTQVLWLGDKPLYFRALSQWEVLVGCVDAVEGGQALRSKHIKMNARFLTILGGHKTLKRDYNNNKN